jgi:nucleoside 2-deoxyribosyltransferase
MKTKIYIAGPITGFDLKERRHTFSNIEDFLKDNGRVPVNPMALPHNHDKSWESYMRECIAALVTCDEIFMLKNWEASKGAKIEFYIADKMGMKIIFEK